MKHKKTVSGPRFEQTSLEEIRELLLPEGKRQSLSESARKKSNGRQNGQATAKKVTRIRQPRPGKNIKIDLAKDLWISPNLSMRCRHGDRAWDRSGNLPPGAGMRLLELADVALGLKKPAHHKKADSAPHQVIKEEPYSL
jgi:hypothetical protein